MHQNVLLDPDPGKENPMRPCLIFFVAILPLHWLASSSETNLLANPGFELGLEGWTTDHAAIRQASPPPHQGTNYLMGSMGGAANSYTHQTIDLVAAGFDPADYESFPFEVHFGGWQAGWQTQTDAGRIELILWEGTNELHRLDLGWFYSNMTWTLKEGTLSLPPATRQITFGFYARRASGSNNDGYLDDAFLFVSPQRPVISSIDLAEETVHLHLTNLYPGAIYSVLRAPALFGMQWAEAGSFTAEQTTNIWSGTVDVIPSRFYRLQLQP
jgi:hypothetical protein